MVDVPDWVKRLTDEYSTDRFHVNHHVFRYNHMYQGIIALWQIGGTEVQARRYAEHHSKQLEPVTKEEREGVPSHQIIPADELKELLGASRKYLHLVAHFRQRLVDLGNDRDLLINQEFPALSSGIAASALHGIIQLGYGYLANDDRLLCEGLAYLHFRFVPHNVTWTDSLIESLGSGDQDVMDILTEIKEDDTLLTFGDDTENVLSDERRGSQSSRRLASLLMRTGDQVADLATKVMMPEFFKKDNLDRDQLKKISNWMIDCAILVYGMSASKNNFFLLHGVTGAWGLSQILPLLTDKKEALKTIIYFLSALFAVYKSENCPTLQKENLTSVVPKSWDELKKDILATVLDEHVYKLTHVCQRRFEENPEESMHEVYIKAAHLATYNKYSRADRAN